MKRAKKATRARQKRAREKKAIKADEKLEHEEKFYDRVAQCELRLRHLEMHDSAAKEWAEHLNRHAARKPYLDDLKSICHKVMGHLSEYCSYLDRSIKKASSKAERKRLLESKDAAENKAAELKARIKEQAAVC